MLSLGWQGPHLESLSLDVGFPLEYCHGALGFDEGAQIEWPRGLFVVTSLGLD